MLGLVRHQPLVNKVGDFVDGLLNFDFSQFFGQLFHTASIVQTLVDFFDRDVLESFLALQLFSATGLCHIHHRSCGLEVLDVDTSALT